MQPKAQPVVTLKIAIQICCSSDTAAAAAFYREHQEGSHAAFPSNCTKSRSLFTLSIHAVLKEFAI